MDKFQLSFKSGFPPSWWNNFVDHHWYDFIYESLSSKSICEKFGIELIHYGPNNIFTFKSEEHLTEFLLKYS